MSNLSEDEFKNHLKTIQPQLRTLAQGMLEDGDGVEEAVTSAARLLSERREEYKPDSSSDGDFLSWAVPIALGAIAVCRRKQIQAFGQAIREQLEREMADLNGEAETRQPALRQCLEKMATSELELLATSYGGEDALQGWADRRDMSLEDARRHRAELRRQMKQRTESYTEDGHA